MRIKRLCALFFSVSMLCIFFATLESCRSYGKKSIVKLNPESEPFEKLSEYQFFQHVEGQLNPNERVFPYSQINSMFSDYLSKEKFMFIPVGTKIEFDTMNVFRFGIGTCLINSTYYLMNPENKNSPKHYVETQLLIRNHTGWSAWEYIWDNNQKDATLSNIGEIKTLNWTDKNGIRKEVEYVFATKSQCKSCHWYDNKILPIGLKARNLNKEIKTEAGNENQLQYWADLSLLNGFADSLTPTPITDWRDTLKPTFARIKSYFEINCAHCHNPNGPAYVSGLFLNWENEHEEDYGIYKSPPSAGRGSCNLRYDVVPGKPGESIMVCRMASTELGIKMPTLGRTTVDNEGISLVIQWISELDKKLLVK